MTELSEGNFHISEGQKSQISQTCIKTGNIKRFAKLFTKLFLNYNLNRSDLLASTKKKFATDTKDNLHLFIVKYTKNKICLKQIFKFFKE